jgi:methylphosphotriester-DNA--protein-cysteine methyltransferase
MLVVKKVINIIYQIVVGQKKIKPENQIWFQTEEEAIKAGYEPCNVCNPRKQQKGGQQARLIYINFSFCQ